MPNLCAHGPHLSAPLQVAGIASEVLRQGVLQPESAWLGAGLRWPAVLLRQLGSRAAAGSQKEWNGTSWWTPKDAFAAAISRDTLQRSSNRQLAVRMLLGELLPLYQSSGHREAARRLVQGLAQTGWQLIIGGPGCESVGSQLCTGQLDSDSLGTLPELADAVQRLLQAQFPASDWPGGSSGGGQSEGGGGGIRGGGSQDVGSSAGDDESSGSEDGTSGAGGIISFRQVCQSKYDLEQLASCITFWLLCGGGHLGLEGQLACAQVTAFCASVGRAWPAWGGLFVVFVAQAAPPVLDLRTACIHALRLLHMSCSWRACLA